MDDTQESVLSTLDEIEKSELERAAEFAYVDNITACSCRGMCLRERGRNACPCRSVTQLCSTACHSGTGRSACLNTNSILGENSSDSEDETDNSITVCELPLLLYTCIRVFKKNLENRDRKLNVFSTRQPKILCISFVFIFTKVTKPSFNFLLLCCFDFEATFGNGGTK